MYLIFDPFLLCLPMGLTTDEKPTADHKVGQHTHTYIHIHTHTYDTESGMRLRVRCETYGMSPKTILPA